MEPRESSESSENIDFQEYWSVLKRRWLPAVAVVAFVVGLTYINTSKQKPVYQAEGKLLIKTSSASSLTGLGEKIGELSSLSKDTSPLDTEAEIVRSVPIAERTIAALNLKDKKGNLLKPQDILAGLSVKGIKGTDVLKISYKSSVPKETAAVINTWMQIYIENNVLTNRAETTAAGEFIAKQLPISEESVRQAEADFRDFKQKNNVVSIKDETGEAVKLIADLDSKIAEAQGKLADATAQSAAIRDKIGIDPKEAITVSAPLSESTGVKTALEDLQKVEGQLATERSRFQEGHPVIINLESKRAALKAVLQERIAQTLGSQQQVSGRNLQFSKVQEQLTQDFVKAEMLRSGAAKEVDSLLRSQAAYKQRLTILPQLEKTQRELERKLEAAQFTYEMLLKKLQEIRVTEKQNVGNARVVENALVPESPTGPSKNLNLAVGGVLGILLSVATILILEITDTSIRSVKQVRNRFGYKLLGMVPAYRKKATPMGLPLGRSVPEIPVRDAPWSPISEAYQMLQANLRFLSSDKAIKVIVVTSSVSKEGKSTVSANLAVAMAQVGRQVLLIDADMRCPFQHHLWELPNSLGLSDIILDEVEFRTAVKKVMPDLDVLTSGLTPPNPNPVALIDSKRMTSLIKNLSETYDFVIIDTPAVSSAAETLILGQLADGVLLVVQPGVVDSPSAAASKELLEQSSQHILGLVVNGVPVKNKQNRYGAQQYPTKKELTTWKKNMHMNRENADIKN